MPGRVHNTSSNVINFTHPPTHFLHARFKLTQSSCDDFAPKKAFVLPLRDITNPALHQAANRNTPEIF